MSTQVNWLAPAPLWQPLSALSDKTQFRSPTILRFATDTFMQDLQNVLQNAPQTLQNFVAQPENWRNPGVGLGYTGPKPALPLKLYQPTHQRFYLIASSLACRKPGLPDHTVNKAARENVVFVLRQLRPNAGYSVADCATYSPVTCSEYAWIPMTGGTSASGSTPASTQSAPNNQAGWMLASGPDLVQGEEQIPLSHTQTGSNGTSRRVYIGLIPASRRQQYFAGSTLSSNSSSSNSGSSGSSTTSTDPRMDLFHRQVVGPWWNLEDWWSHLDPASSSKVASENQLSAQLSSALILYDFATFLSLYIPNVWAAITGSASLTTAETTLYNTLGSALRTALVNANAIGPELESIGPSNALPSGYTPYALTDPANLIKPHTLNTPVANALPPLTSVSVPVPVLPPLPQKPSLSTGGDYWYIIRCVYLRPQCPGSSGNVISPPSQPFQLASYFDSDAPARRVQVALPIDTSPAALRKYDKGVAFMLSKELRNQMARAASLTDLGNGQLGPPGGLTVGWICSLSIPIITICAMILLLIIVIALNLVFFWIPFFKICFPVPELEGE